MLIWINSTTVRKEFKTDMIPASRTAKAAYSRVAKQKEVRNNLISCLSDLGTSVSLIGLLSKLLCLGNLMAFFVPMKDYCTKNNSNCCSF